MTRRSWLTLIVLGGVVIGLIVLLIREATRGPMFRAEDHRTYAECIQNIPVEWARGSLEYMGAESACGFVHEATRPLR
jgi:hypothetical protein